MSCTFIILSLILQMENTVVKRSMQCKGKAKARLVNQHCLKTQVEVVMAGFDTFATLLLCFYIIKLSQSRHPYSNYPEMKNTTLNCVIALTCSLIRRPNRLTIKVLTSF